MRNDLAIKISLYFWIKWPIWEKSTFLGNAALPEIQGLSWKRSTRFYGFRFTSTQICFFLFSSFPLSAYHIYTFPISIFAYFQKRKRTWTVCIPSGRCSIKQKGISSDPGIVWTG
jgi:hypothetical protein